MFARRTGRTPTTTPGSVGPVQQAAKAGAMAGPAATSLGANGRSSAVGDLWSLVSDFRVGSTKAPPKAVPKPPPSVDDFIALVKKVEAAHPEWTAEDVTNALRGIGGYDTPSWQKMLGTSKAPGLEPGGDLTAEDIAALKGMVAHHHNGTTEGGVVTDHNGQGVAMGHVITGLSAGQHRDRDRNLAGVYGWLGLGEDVDNLFATTISGDLGQSAHMVNEGTQSTYVGTGTEATDTELNGDIDGFLMGNHLQELTKGEGLGGKVPLSEVLSYYYVDNACSIDGPSGPISADRYEGFAGEVNRSDLTDQTKRFAANYGYTTNVDDNGGLDGWLEDKLGKDPDGLFRATGGESEDAVDVFGTWLNQRRGKTDGQEGSW